VRVSFICNRIDEANDKEQTYLMSSTKGNEMETIGGRLRFERERLALSQPVLAEMCGVTMRSQRNYEKDERLPDAGYLAAATRSGVDVVYVLTGERLPGTPALTPEESALLDNFRHSPPAARKAIKATSDLLAQHGRPGDEAECG